MNDAWGWWLFFVGLGAGIAGYALVRGVLHRTDADEAADERANEAAWISRTLDAWGGEAPVELVSQILDLHTQYLGGEAFLAPDGPIPVEAEPVVDAPLAPEPQAPTPARAAAPDAPDVQRDGATGEPPEAHLSQAG